MVSLGSINDRRFASYGSLIQGKSFLRSVGLGVPRTVLADPSFDAPLFVGLNEASDADVGSSDWLVFKIGSGCVRLEVGSWVGGAAFF